MLSCNSFIKSTIYSQNGNVKEIQTPESLTQGHKIVISGIDCNEDIDNYNTKRYSCCNKSFLLQPKLSPPDNLLQ